MSHAVNLVFSQIKPEYNLHVYTWRVCLCNSGARGVVELDSHAGAEEHHLFAILFQESKQEKEPLVWWTNHVTLATKKTNTVICFVHTFYCFLLKLLPESKEKKFHSRETFTCSIPSTVTLLPSYHTPSPPHHNPPMKDNYWSPHLPIRPPPSCPLITHPKGLCTCSSPSTLTLFFLSSPSFPSPPGTLYLFQSLHSDILLPIIQNLSPTPRDSVPVPAPPLWRSPSDRPQPFPHPQGLCTCSRPSTVALSFLLSPTFPPPPGTLYLF